MAQALSSSVSIFSQSKLVNKFRFYSVILLLCYSFNDSILKLGIPNSALCGGVYIIRLKCMCVVCVLIVHAVYSVYKYTRQARYAVQSISCDFQFSYQPSAFSLFLSVPLSLSRINEKGSQVKSGYSSFNIIFLYSTDLRIILNNLRHPEIIIDKQYYTAQNCSMLRK